MQLKPTTKPTTIDGRAAVVLAVCCMIWGVGLVMVKIANTGISPVFNAALRSIAAAAVLFLWARWRGIAVFRRDGALWAGMFCAVLFALEFVTLYRGLQLTPASRGTIFLHAAPFVAALGEHFLVPGHRLTGLRLIGLLAAFAGLVVALGEGIGGLTGSTLEGDLLCLAGGIFWGGTTVIVRTTALGRVPAEKTLLYQLTFSIPILLGWAWFTGEPGIGTLTPAVLGAFAYTVLLVVVVGYTTWFWLMRTYSAASLHSFTFLSPIFGVIAGHLILGEKIGTGALSGLALVALGIYLVNRPAASR